MKSIRYIIPCILFAMALATSCEDMMTKKIDIDSADFSTRLAVTATLDTDSGRLTMVVYEGKSFALYNQKTTAYGPIIKNGVAKLYQDGQLVWTFAGDFDLRRDKYYQENESTTPYYQTINAKNIPVKAGSTYKLEIDVDGYQKVVSTAVMPADPLISDVFMDTENVVDKKNIKQLNYYNLFISRYYPVKFSLEDNSAGQDYYALQIERFDQSDNEKYPYGEGAGNSMGVGVSNLALIQDNPDLESESSLLGDGESYDLYMFNTLLISDITFPGSRATLELFSSSYQINGLVIYPNRMPGYDPAKHGPEVIVEHQYILLVKHITAETFKHYRSLLLQEQGMGFFAEPVKITSNIENGYGCFSLQNTRRIVLKKLQFYYYPENRMYN